MTHKPDGDPAYPRQTDIYSNGADGMSLRDYFAGQALAGFCNNFSNGSVDVSWLEQYGASNAYKVADAMIAARGTQ